jgi:hypothetical protein
MFPMFALVRALSLRCDVPDTRQKTPDGEYRPKAVREKRTVAKSVRRGDDPTQQRNVSRTGGCGKGPMALGIDIAAPKSYESFR